MNAFKNEFNWNAIPTDADFLTAIEDAFAVWKAADGATGLGTTLDFVRDPLVAPMFNSPFGAEIDLFARTFPQAGIAGFAQPHYAPGPVDLTSGTVGYNAPAMAGVDIRLNKDAVWTLGTFQRLLSHEIGHALGLNDVDVASGATGNFIDDNFNGANNATVVNTLTNSFALQVNPLNPAVSPLGKFFVNNGIPGFDTAGADILMESNTAGSITGLQNDDFAGRQFLYPEAPPPAVPNFTLNRNGWHFTLNNLNGVGDPNLFGKGSHGLLGGAANDDTFMGQFWFYYRTRDPAGGAFNAAKSLSNQDFAVIDAAGASALLQYTEPSTIAGNDLVFNLNVELQGSSFTYGLNVQNAGANPLDVDLFVLYDPDHFVDSNDDTAVLQAFNPPAFPGLGWYQNFDSDPTLPPGNF